MKRQMYQAMLLGLLLPITMTPYGVVNQPYANLQRLQHLCNDYQLPIQGYVVEGWLKIPHILGMEFFLQEKMKLSAGNHHVELSDGGILNTGLHKQNKTWYIELQCITTNEIDAMSYYVAWQQFSDQYCNKIPIGITVITSIQERLEEPAGRLLMGELAYSLGIQVSSETVTDQYIQLSGKSKQLHHNLNVNGEPINASIMLIPEQDCTNLYIATPVIYQQI